MKKNYDRNTFLKCLQKKNIKKQQKSWKEKEEESKMNNKKGS